MRQCIEKRRVWNKEIIYITSKANWRGRVDAPSSVEDMELDFELHVEHIFVMCLKFRTFWVDCKDEDMESWMKIHIHMIICCYNYSWHYFGAIMRSHLIFFYTYDAWWNMLVLGMDMDCVCVFCGPLYAMVFCVVEPCATASLFISLIYKWMGDPYRCQLIAVPVVFLKKQRIHRSVKLDSENLMKVQYGHGMIIINS